MPEKDKSKYIPERYIHYDHYKPGGTKPLDKNKTSAASAPQKQKNKK